jgi:hypothetical protein
MRENAIIEKHQNLTLGPMNWAFLLKEIKRMRFAKLAEAVSVSSPTQTKLSSRKNSLTH